MRKEERSTFNTAHLIMPATPDKNIILSINYLKTKFIHRYINIDDVYDFGSDCLVCGKKVNDLVHIDNQYDKTILSKVYCKHCEYIYFNKYPDSGWFENYYSKQWDQAREQPRVYSSESADYTKNFNILEKTIENKNSKILDLGAGYGGFMSKCKGNGYENIYGVEASIKRFEYCNSNNLQVYLSTAENLIENIPDEHVGTFDLIHSHHVLEHVNDLNKSIDNLSALLKPDGKLILFVPNVLFENVFVIANGIIHARNFTKKSISHLLVNHNYKIEYVDDDISLVACKTDANQKQIDVENHVSSEDIKNKIIKDMFPNLSANEDYIYMSSNIRNANFINKMIFRIKEVIWGVENREEPLSVIFKNIFSLNIFRDSIKKIMRKAGMGKFEYSGYIKTISTEDNEALPFLTIKYKSDNVVGLIK